LVLGYKSGMFTILQAGRLLSAHESSLPAFLQPSID
jgi:hypothetical protein